jgi:CMP-N-acetylneuraminic acid synthetase
MGRSRQTIVAMIPARMGSTRLPAKNLALLNGKPLIYYAIKAAKDSGVFDRIIVNAESDIFANIAGRYGVEFYKRPDSLASSTAKSDSVVYDFVKNIHCDIAVWVNTIAPFQTGIEVRDVVRHFIKEELDSLITVKDEQVHCVYKGRPVNYSAKGLFAQTQDLAPVRPFVYSVMMWRTRPFIRDFEEKGHAFFCGKFGVYPVKRLSSVIIKKEEDLALADNIMRAMRKSNEFKVRYDRLIKSGRGA